MVWTLFKRSLRELLGRNRITCMNCWESLTPHSFDIPIQIFYWYFILQSTAAHYSIITLNWIGENRLVWAPSMTGISITHIAYSFNKILIYIITPLVLCYWLSIMLSIILTAFAMLRFLSLHFTTLSIYIFIFLTNLAATFLATTYFIVCERIRCVLTPANKRFHYIFFGPVPAQNRGHQILKIKMYYDDYDDYYWVLIIYNYMFL